jgi:di/tricarboxylate transporter
MFQLPEWAPAALTLIIIGAASYSFVRERLPPDMTALFALMALLLTGVLTPGEAFSGFSHPATVSVAAVLVLSAGLQRTGALTFVARRVLAPLGRSEFLLTLVLMIVVGGISMFINNTAAVAIFIPVVLEACRRGGMSPGRVLMPMAHAATLGGMCTLIGTSTNIAAHEYARSQGLPGFGMFELGQVGLPMLVASFAYILLVGRWFLPRTGRQTGESIGQDASYLGAIIVPEGSRWIGRPVRPEQFPRHFDLELVDLVRDKESILVASPPPRYQAGDRLRLRGPLDELLALAANEGLEIHRPALEPSVAPADDAGITEDPAPPDMAVTPPANAPPAGATRHPLVEVVVLPGSGLVGRTLATSRFAARFDAVVLALKRPGAVLGERPESIPIHGGDVLVIEGTEAALRRISGSPGFLVVGSPSYPDMRPHKLGIVLLTVVSVIAVAALGWLPIVTAAAAGCAVLIVTRCLEPREAYQAIDLSIVFLLAGALALGIALQKTGLADGLAGLLAHITGFTGPHVLLAGFFIAAVLLSEMMSNSGTVLLLAPIAVSSAEQLGVNPLALIAAVAFGASAAFAMPIGYQTSLMIYGPGGYRFRDFVRMGIPLDIILAAIALTLIPRFWPLTPP